MRTIALANSKGGVGKTTLCSALAVCAAAEGKVALIDLDPQASLASWCERRLHSGADANPKLFEMPGASEAVELLKSEGNWTWCLIDSPPSELPRIETAIAAADVVLIPCGPSAVDVEQVNIAAELCETHGKPFAFVITRAMPTWKLTKTTTEYLSRGLWRGNDWPANGPDAYVVLEPVLATRTAYMSGMTVGRTGPEMDKAGEAAAEIDALWEAVKAFTVNATKRGRA
jgi:chromosome partitioning protein